MNTSKSNQPAVATVTDNKPYTRYELQYQLENGNWHRWSSKANCSEAEAVAHFAEYIRKERETAGRLAWILPAELTQLPKRLRVVRCECQPLELDILKGLAL